MGNPRSIKSIKDYNMFYNEYIRYVPNSLALFNLINEFIKTDEYDKCISKKVIILLNAVKEKYNKCYRNLPDRYKLYYRSFIIKEIKKIANDSILNDLNIRSMNTYISNNIKSVISTFIKVNIPPIYEEDTYETWKFI